MKTYCTVKLSKTKIERAKNVIKFFMSIYNSPIVSKVYYFSRTTTASGKSYAFKST